MKRLIHALTRSHSWIPMGRFRQEWIDGFRFWNELLLCDCGATTWDCTRAAIHHGFRAEVGS